MSPERLVRVTRRASVKASEVAAVYEDEQGVWVMFLSGKCLGVGRDVSVEGVSEQVDAARREAASG